VRGPVASAEVGASTISLHEGPVAERPYELGAMESPATGFLHIVRRGPAAYPVSRGISGCKAAHALTIRWAGCGRRLGPWLRTWV